MNVCQITQNFDEVVALASSPRPEWPRQIYFENDESLSSNVRNLYDSSFITFLIEEGPECIDLSFSTVLHIIVALYQSRPLSLEFLAMKKVLELELEVQVLPRELQVKAKKVYILLDLTHFN